MFAPENAAKRSARRPANTAASGGQLDKASSTRARTSAMAATTATAASTAPSLRKSQARSVRPKTAATRLSEAPKARNAALIVAVVVERGARVSPSRMKLAAAADGFDAAVVFGVEQGLHGRAQIVGAMQHRRRRRALDHQVQQGHLAVERGGGSGLRSAVAVASLTTHPPEASRS